MARADWLVKLRISFAIYLRTTQDKMASSLHPRQVRETSKLIVCGVYYLTVLERILGRTPVYLKQMLKLNSDTHNRSTRFSNLNFNCPHYKNETEGGRTFTVRSIKEWNNLDKDLKELKNAKL